MEMERLTWEVSIPTQMVPDIPADPGCESALDGDEADGVLPACSDGIDNDGDGAADYPE